MSGHGFHVHGPHDHAVEHAAHSAHEDGGGDSYTRSIALFTAIAATVGAVFAYMGGATQTNAMLYKSNAAIHKTDAANRWNHFQAKNSRQHQSELAMALAPAAKKAAFQEEIDRYEDEKSEIKAVAERLETQSKRWDEASDAQIHLHHRWAQATTVLQVAIAMAAIALLSRRRWLQYIMYGAGVMGAVLGAMAALHI